MRRIDVPSLLTIPGGTEVAWWIEFGGFVDSVAAIQRHPDDVEWQKVTEVEDDDTHVIVTVGGGGQSAVSKRGKVVIRTTRAVPAGPLLARVLDDIHNRRVSITDGAVIILADDTQVEPYEHEEYITTVQVLRDTSWAMEEQRANTRGDFYLRLTTVGDQMRIRGVEAVTV